MENDNKVKSWDLGEPNSTGMLEMGDQSFVIWGGRGGGAEWILFLPYGSK